MQLVAVQCAVGWLSHITLQVLLGCCLLRVHPIGPSFQVPGAPAPPPTPRPTGPSSPLSRLPATLQPPMAGVVSVWEVCAHLPDQTTPPRPGRGGIGRKLLQDGCPPSPLKRGDSLISPPVTLFWCFGRPWGEVVFRIDFFIKKTLTECGLPGGFWQNIMKLPNIPCIPPRVFG